MSSKQPQCCRCGHLVSAGTLEEPFLQAPCSHLYCSKCVHRLFALQSRISCSLCARPLFRHELSASSASKEDQFHHVVSNTRKRICGVMNKERGDFQATPLYDDFLELREDLITQFIELYDTSGQSKPTKSREELEKTLHKFEIENQEQIIHARSTAEDKKRRKIEEIIGVEGTLFERINVDFNERDGVTDHELAIQFADLLARGVGDKFTQHASADLLSRKTRLIHQQNNTAQLPPAVPVIAEASGCKDLWKQRALDVIKTSFSLVS